ncbi:MAG: hypothetical protein JWN99_76 [Ilumatobacteraceae bacterium]|nr:hypothetical protein [Ilumatobacteraceae bacterium]
MQRSHRVRRLAVVTATTLAALAGTVFSGPVIVNAGAASRFQPLPMPAGLDVANLPSHANPDLEVSAIVRLDGASALTVSADAAASNQRVDHTQAAQQVLDSQQAVTAQLQAAGASIEGNVTTVMNAVRIRAKVKDLPAMAAIAGVTGVSVSRTYRLQNGNSDAYTGVDSVWQDLGVSGAGMTIAVIDDGIDYYHADFGGVDGQAKYEADDGLSIDPTTFPTAKVIAGYDFAGDAYDADADEPGESKVPVPDPDPLACGEHGTHVAGTAAGAGVLADGTTFAGPYDDTTLDNDFLVAPGAAPEASIESYKVFGCSGSSDDSVILAAIDAAVASGADVVNMSLGSTFGAADDPIALAVDAASAAGVMMVVSAGNEGTGAYVVGGPSTANSALSDAADDALAMSPAVDVTGAVTTVGQNSNAVEVAAPLTGELVKAGLGCTPDDFASAAGKIAVTVRGTCDRVARAQLGTTAGALGVIFINDGAGLPPIEGAIDGATIPFVGVSPVDGALFQSAIGQVITLAAGPTIANPSYQQSASFTSNGPRLGDSALKPDISAPGVSVVSARAGSGTGSIIESGTSMASPHTAGIAALVRQTHPDWDPAAVKAAMMSTASPEGVVGYDTRANGAGLVDARTAVDTVAFISTDNGLDNLSFGFQEIATGTKKTRTFHITNTSATPLTYDLTSSLDDAGTGATLTLIPSSVTVPAGGSSDVTAQLRITDPSLIPGAADNDGGAIGTISGFVIAEPRETGVGIDRLVTPLMMVPNGLSDVRATPVRNWNHHSDLAPLPYRIKLYNGGLHSGVADFYQWAITDHTGDVGDSRVPDILDVGVQSFPFDDTGPLIVFAISTAQNSNTQSLYEYDIAIDSNGDGQADFLLAGVDGGLLTTGIPDGTYASALFAADGTPVALLGASAPANGSIVEIAVPAGAMENPGKIDFSVVVQSVTPGITAFDETRVGSYSAGTPAVHAIDPQEPGTDFPYISLEPNQYVPVQVTVDRRQVHEQHALGWLVVTTDDAAGIKEADRVPLRP